MMSAHARLALALAGLVAPALILTAGLVAPAAARPTPVPPAHQAPPVARVVIAGYAFRPQTLTVVPGTTVTWTNTDSAIHTVVSDTTAFMASQDLATGQTFTHTFATVGTFTYHCGQHAFMTGTIVVKGRTRPTHEQRRDHEGGAPVVVVRQPQSPPLRLGRGHDARTLALGPPHAAGSTTYSTRRTRPVCRAS